MYKTKRRVAFVFVLLVKYWVVYGNHRVSTEKKNKNNHFRLDFRTPKVNPKTIKRRHRTTCLMGLKVRYEDLNGRELCSKLERFKRQSSSYDDRFFKFDRKFARYLSEYFENSVKDFPRDSSRHRWL